MKKYILYIVLMGLLISLLVSAKTASAKPSSFEEWCGPGYWRQEHHYDSWVATGLSPDIHYSSVSSLLGDLTLSRKGVKDGATLDPSLIQILDNPQWYGNESGKKVADLLSQLHPGVNFLGNRIKGNCPLN